MHFLIINNQRDGREHIKIRTSVRPFLFFGIDDVAGTSCVLLRDNFRTARSVEC